MEEVLVGDLYKKMVKLGDRILDVYETIENINNDFEEVVADLDGLIEDGIDIKEMVYLMQHGSVVEQSQLPVLLEELKKVGLI